MSYDEILVEQDGSIYVGGKPLREWSAKFAAEFVGQQSESNGCNHVSSRDPRRNGTCAKCGKEFHDGRN